MIPTTGIKPQHTLAVSHVKPGLTSLMKIRLRKRVACVNLSCESTPSITLICAPPAGVTAVYTKLLFFIVSGVKCHWLCFPCVGTLLSPTLHVWGIHNVSSWQRHNVISQMSKTDCVSFSFLFLPSCLDIPYIRQPCWLRFVCRHKQMICHHSMIFLV